MAKKRKMEQEEKARKAREVTEKKWTDKFPWLLLTGKRSDKGHARGLCRLCKEHCPNKSVFGFFCKAYQE